MTSEGTDEKTGTKILGLIEELNRCDEAGVTVLADRLGIAKSTAYYHLETLRERGFVVKSDGEYHLSLRFLRIGEQRRNDIPLYKAAREQIDHLAQETDELAILMVEEQGFGVYLYKAAGANAIDIDAPIGRFARLHDRALGKAILAHTDERRVREIVDEHGLPRTTEQTVASAEQLFDEFEQIRREGVAYNFEEAMESLYGLAVPILDENDTVLGAISIAGPSKRLEGEKMNEEFPALLSQARNIVELNVNYSTLR